MKRIKKYIKRGIKAYINNMNEFYKPLIEAGVPIIV
jgi:hypothetical protein